MDENQSGTGKWFWIGTEFKDLPPVLKQRFVDNHKSRKNTFAALIKKTLRSMLPGDVKGFGPLLTKADADYAAHRISNLASNMRWPEGYICGTMQDDDGKWWASVMRKAESENS